MHDLYAREAKFQALLADLAARYPEEFAQAMAEAERDAERKAEIYRPTLHALAEQIDRKILGFLLEASK